MKNYLLISIIILISLCIENVFAEDFLGVPIMPQSREIQIDETRLEMTTDLSHDVVVKFYKGALNRFPYIKYRDWKNATYIEDDGKLKWHSITISKREIPTSIVIVKDSWTWILGTLVLRYISVFVVLSVIFISITLSGNIIPRAVNRTEVKSPGRHKDTDRPTRKEGSGKISTGDKHNIDVRQEENIKKPTLPPSGDLHNTHSPMKPDVKQGVL